jgi:hypothetical protein
VGSSADDPGRWGNRVDGEDFMTFDELEQLNNEAWRRGRPFIQTDYGTLKSVSPSQFQEDRQRMELLNSYRSIYVQTTYGPGAHDDSLHAAALASLANKERIL